MSPSPPPSIAFADQVDTWISGALAEGKRTFGEVLCALPGVYPTEVLPSLHRITAAGGLQPNCLSAIERDASRRRTPIRRGIDWLPLPHPLDFEWRFSGETCAALLARADALNRRDQPIALIGTPGLCAHLLEHGPIGRPFSFLGEANVVTGELRRRAIREAAEISFLACDANPGLADTVVIDPPWYADYIRPLFRMAAAACHVGGHVLVSLPPEGARPSARTDRRQTLALARRLGLRAIACEPGTLAYDTPFFEWNSLAAAGVRNLPPTWRRGDLLIFERLPIRVAPMAKRQTASAWEETVVHGVRFRTRMTAAPSDCGEKPAGLIPILENDVLPSVSRRDPRRAGVDVWTSGNRIFRCRRPDLVRLACWRLLGEAWPEGRLRVRNAAEEAEVERIASDLSGVVALELAELKAFGRREGWKYSRSARSASRTCSARSDVRHSGATTCIA